MARLLSASRISCVTRCPREYVCKYHMGLTEKKSEALLHGSAFHQMLDGKTPDLTDLRAADPEYPWADCLNVMLAGYKAEMQIIGGETAARELDLSTERFRLIVDEVRMVGAQWFIVENKTATKEPKWARLPADVQNLLYVSQRDSIAQTCWVDPADFGGLIYTATLKPQERRKKNETAGDFSARLTSSTISKILRPEAFSSRSFTATIDWAEMQMDALDGCWNQSKSLEDIPANTASCERYGSPCPFFEVCHGK
jgi:hypothetical protein